MGRDYEFSLRFPREEVWDVLEDVGEMASRLGEKQIEVVLPERTLVLPFTSNFESASIYTDNSLSRLQFDTSLYFELDEFIEQYIKEGEEDFRKLGGHRSTWTHPRDSFGRVQIGYIYLCINLQPDIVTFDFESATTRMGILFTQSLSMRCTFVQLLEMHNGISGVIQDSDYQYDPIIVYPAK